MKFRRILIPGILSLALLGDFSTTAKVSIPYKPLNRDEFVPILVEPNLVILEPNTRKSYPKTSNSRVVAVPSVVLKSTVKTSYTGRYTRGYASWYCKSGVSVCHYKYPAGSMAAAACGKLRNAMGSNWRGKYVNVKKGSRSVRVKLVDWCGSKSKLIDLYWEPMRRLGGKGVLYVKISW